MKSIKNRVRSEIVKPEDLDDFLIEIQRKGMIINQVLPCPKSADFSQHEHAKVQVGAMVFDMQFVVLYIETQTEV